MSFLSKINCMLGRHEPQRRDARWAGRTYLWAVTNIAEHRLSGSGVATDANGRTKTGQSGF